MSADNAANVAVSILASATVAHLWTGFCPDFVTIGNVKESDTDQTAYWLRRGEATSTAISIALGVSASYVSKSYLPFIASVAMSAYLMWIYESALRSGSTPPITAGRDDS